MALELGDDYRLGQCGVVTIVVDADNRDLVLLEEGAFEYGGIVVNVGYGIAESYTHSVSTMQSLVWHFKNGLQHDLEDEEVKSEYAYSTE